MESELCGSAYGSNSEGSSSESEDKELEAELYSVLHYSDFSKGIPEELNQKYDIVLNDTECYIQLKTREPDESDCGEKLNVSTDSVEADEDSRQCSSSSDSSVNEIVILERDPFPISTRVDSKSVYEILSSDMSSVHSLSGDSSDSSDLIVLEDPNRRSPIILSDDDDLQINLDRTDEDDGSMSDGQVSDAAGGLSYDWKNVSSPSRWSDSMRKYYNRPCSTLRYFDFRKIKNNLMNEKGAKWPINNGDKFNVNIPRRRCRVCREPGHIAQACPKRYPVCLMCGTEGHTRKQCPDSKCLNCGRNYSSYIPMCGKCRRTSETTTCYNCQQRGHCAKDCPNNWRKFHLITGVGSTTPQSDASVNPNVNCSNCGEQGHFYEKCRQGYFSLYPPVSSLVIKGAHRKTTPDVEPRGSRKRKMESGSDVQRNMKPQRKKVKRNGKEDFFRHLSFDSREGKKRSGKRQQKRYFNLTA